jgi:hypothetical protein
MSPTPDERRATWVEPGTAKRVVDGRVESVAIDLARATAYQGNGISGHGYMEPSRPVVVLSAGAIRRLARLVDPPQGEDHETDRCPRCLRLRGDIRDGEGCGEYADCPGTMERSPQGEDHEAGIEAAARVNHAMYPQQDYEEAHMEAERIVAAYLSRCPSPVSGTEPDRWTIASAMQEDGLHGIDGWRVVRGTEVADDSFFADEGSAQEMADRLNREDRGPEPDTAKLVEALRQVAEVARTLVHAQAIAVDALRDDDEQ